MGEKKDPKAELRGFAEHIQGMSDEELDEVIGGIGGWGGSIRGDSGSTGTIQTMIRQYLDAQS